MTNKELAEALWQEYKGERDEKKTAPVYKPYTLGDDTLRTIYHLLRDYGTDSEAYPYVCEEYLHTISYRNYEFNQVVENAVNSYRALRDKGVQIPEGNLAHLETLLKMVNQHSEYMRVIEENAEQGIWDEKVRGNIKGFDLINENIGSFHDSEVLDFKVDADNRSADLTLHMCNGANSIVKLHFESNVSCDISTDGYVYLYFGYFYKEGGNVVLDLDGFGRISAQHVEVVEVKELDDEGESQSQPAPRLAPKKQKPREGANSVVLKWNPAISSYPMSDFLNHIVNANRGYNEILDWSVHDYDKIKKGDVVYWLKVGYGQCGIVGRGIVASKPYEGQDWSGKGRKTYYVDFYATELLNPDALQLPDSDSLSEAIPDFDWYGGHSGMVLTETQAKKLGTIWRKHLVGLKNDQTLLNNNRHNDKVFLG